MKTFHLHGLAADLYGPSFTLDVKSPAEAVKALSVQLPGFQKMIEDHSWHVIRGPLEKQQADDEESVCMYLGTETEFHLVPAMSGAGNGGGLMMIVGVALMVAASFATGGLAAALWGAGIGTTLGGVISSMTKIPTGLSSSESVDSRASFLFEGAKNQSSQGACIPRGYGREFVGSIMVSLSLDAEETAT